MSIRELQDLVKGYQSGSVSYQEFRRQFVEQFLSMRLHGRLNALVNRVEMACAEHSDLGVSEADLKASLAAIDFSTAQHPSWIGGVQTFTNAENVFASDSASAAVENDGFAKAEITLEPLPA